MKKQDKYIREIASRLPHIAEQTVSGYYEDYNEEGELVKFPNVVTHPINHERRIRHAYQKLGMAGIMNYLSWIQKLQNQRNENLQRHKDSEQQQPSVLPETLGVESGPVPGEPGDQGPLLANI